MKIYLVVKPGARKNMIVRKGDGSLVVSVTTLPEKGRANRSVIGLLADYFGTAKSGVRIVSGFSSKNKIAEILGI